MKLQVQPQSLPEVICSNLHNEALFKPQKYEVLVEPQSLQMAEVKEFMIFYNAHVILGVVQYRVALVNQVAMMLLCWQSLYSSHYTMTFSKKLLISSPLYFKHPGQNITGHATVKKKNFGLPI